MKTLGILTITISTLTLGTIWRSYVLSILWAWFIVTTFGLPVLNIPTAIGLSCVVSFLTYQHDHTKDERSGVEKCVEGALVLFLHPLLALFVGWIVKQWL